MEDIIVRARNLGCKTTPSSGKSANLHVRYGGLRYAIIDVDANGKVLLHVKTHPGKELPEEESKAVNALIDDLEGVAIKNPPINHYGQVEKPVEEVPFESIERYMEHMVALIRRLYY